MSDRQPLPGWRGIVSPGGDGRKLEAGPLTVKVYRKTWAIVAATEDGETRITIRCSDDGGVFAAEDAARALLAELAGALPCRWTPGPTGFLGSACGLLFRQGDVWFAHCPGCCGRVEVAP